MDVTTTAPSATAPDEHVGLSGAEVAAGLAEHGPNALPAAAPDPLLRRLLAELREPMAVLLVAAAGVSGVLLGEVVDAVAILVIVVVNATIALVQEGRAHAALESLRELEAPSAVVVRDGVRRSVPARDLVPGDVVLLQAGDRVPADARVARTEAVQVDESILTGESMTVDKRVGGTTDASAPLGDRDGLLHAGTLVARGSATGVVVRTGSSTALGAIATRLQEIHVEPTPLQRQLAALTTRLGFAAILVAAGVLVLMLLVSPEPSLDQAFLAAVALAVASVPEGLATVTTVALALGVSRMADRRAIVRRLPAVETLGAVDVVVVDKTGTITCNRMSPAVVIGPDAAAHAPDELPPALLAALRPVLVLCNDATLDPPTGDPTERGLLELVDPAVVDGLRTAAPRRATAPFTSERKRMSVLHDVGGDALLLVKGAPEVVLPRCTRRAGGDAVTVEQGGTAVSAPGGGQPLDDGARGRLAAVADAHAARGERLLALAVRRLGPAGTAHDGAGPEGLGELEEDLTLLALVALRDPPRASAASSVAALGRAGITLVMATGDHPATAGAIAEEVGIPAAHRTTGARVRAEGLPDDPLSVRVYARVDPDQKLDLVEALQARGHTVAMTGDGVNDATALRRADIGVALGESGSDVAREAADLVITDDDLATILEAVREGRGIYDDLRKVVDYLVASNLAEVLVVVATLVLLPAFGVPLLPLQLLWINLLTDGLPALALGVDPAAPGLMAQRPRDTRVRLLDGPHLRRLALRGGVIAAAGLGALLFAVGPLAMSTDLARTVVFSTLVLAQVLYAFVVHREGRRRGEPATNRWLWASAAAALLLHTAVLLVPPLQSLFHVVTPTPAAWATIGVAGVAAAIAVRLVTVIEPDHRT